MEAVIWDFNGTILDDFSLCLSAINQMLSRRGLPVLSAADYLSVFDFPVQKYYEQVGFNFSVEPFPVLAREYMDIYQPASFTCQLRRGVKATLDFFASRGIRQILLSATKQDFLLEQLDHYKLIPYFRDIIGLDDILGRSKLEQARIWFSQHDLPACETILIGDTTHDHAVASALACQCILVCGGHNSRERLEKTGATVLAEISPASFL